MEEEKLQKAKLNHLVHKELNSILANERTYAAWVRTGLTTLATGLVISKFLQGSLPAGIIITCTILLFIAAFAFFLMAIWRYFHVGAHLETTRIAGASLRFLLIIGSILALVVVLAFIGIFF